MSSHFKHLVDTIPGIFSSAPYCLQKVLSFFLFLCHLKCNPLTSRVILQLPCYSEAARFLSPKLIPEQIGGSLFSHLCNYCIVVGWDVFWVFSFDVSSRSWLTSQACSFGNTILLGLGQLCLTVPTFTSHPSSLWLRGLCPRPTVLYLLREKLQFVSEFDSERHCFD